MAKKFTKDKLTVGNFSHHPLGAWQGYPRHEISRIFYPLVSCYQNCSDLLWEKIVLVIEKTFEICRWRPKIFKHFEITGTIKGQIISKRFFLAKDSSKKRTKTRRTLVKMNSFVRFLEESLAWQFAFEINWPLIQTVKGQNNFW